MKTLIELYDNRPIYNVLSTEMFRPERTVFVCPPDIGRDKALQKGLRAYFARRGVTSEIVFCPTALLDAEAVARALRGIVRRCPDCAMDIAGGTDAALFAAGLLCAENDCAVFTYSRKRNTFYEIRNAPFARNLPCPIVLSVEDCFLMAGGVLRQGRVDNAVLSGYLSLIDPLFEVYMAYRREWPSIVTYIQRVSQAGLSSGTLDAEGALTVKGERGARVAANEDALACLARIGAIRDFSVADGRVSFAFPDALTRQWLRDVGSPLELYTYKACLDAGIYDDVRLSAVVDWQGGGTGGDRVTNEIDVMATRRVRPVFISCKTCDVSTDALNELAILRDRFGGDSARAVIVSTGNQGRGRAAMHHRASELNIDVVDLDDIKYGALCERVRLLAK